MCYTAPASTQVPQEVTQFLAWLNATAPAATAAANSALRLDPIVRAAITHLWFETIHPFEDGNGRVGRALADYVLAQETGVLEPIFSLSTQIQQERKAYYAQLEAAQHASPLPDRAERPGLDVTDWVQWFVAVFQRGCKRTIGSIAHAQATAAFWQRAAPRGINPRQHKVIARLLQASNAHAPTKHTAPSTLAAEHYMQLTGASKATATRDLTQLLAAGLLRVQGQGKATKYAIGVDRVDR